MITAHYPDIHAGFGAGEGLDRQAGRLDRLIHHLHQQPLLRVNGWHLDGLDVKEARVEMAMVLVEKIRLSHVRGAMVVGIRVVIGVRVEPVLGDASEKVSRLEQQVPQLGGARGGSWKSKTASNDGDGLFTTHVVFDAHNGVGGVRTRGELKPGILPKKCLVQTECLQCQRYCSRCIH